MKKLTFSLTIFTFIAMTVVGQTLEENKIDEFTNISIKQTSWETLNMSMAFTAYYRISRINDNDYFDLKLMIGGKVFSIDKDQEIMFKLDNGEFVKLPNIEYAITCTGCGAKGFSGSAAQGIKVSYTLDKEQVMKLKNNTPTKVRIYTNNGYIEDDIKEKYAKNIPTALKLVE